MELHLCCLTADGFETSSAHFPFSPHLAKLIRKPRCFLLCQWGLKPSPRLHLQNDSKFQVSFPSLSVKSFLDQLGKPALFSPKYLIEWVTKSFIYIFYIFSVCVCVLVWSYIISLNIWNKIWNRSSLYPQNGLKTQNAEETSNVPGNARSFSKSVWQNL